MDHESENSPPAVAVLGSGSWATALVKVMTENGCVVRWHIRRPEAAAEVGATGRNARYLPEAELMLDRIVLCETAGEAVSGAEVVFLVVPSAYMAAAASGLPPGALAGKVVVSAIKGVEPESGLLPSEYCAEKLGAPAEQFVVASGPSHAEEVAQRQATYLTVASVNETAAGLAARCLRADYMYATLSRDVTGVEYAGALKNIYTIGAGLASGLGYQNNFIAVYLGACLREMRAYKAARLPETPGRDITQSAYLGDLLTTAYSRYSRNRQLGLLIGEGRTPEQALSEMSMVAEGYFASRAMALHHELDFPIARLVHRTLYEGAEPAALFRELEPQLV